MRHSTRSSSEPLGSVAGMYSRCATFALVGVLAVGLVGCAPEAEPDWAAAEAAAQEFEGVASSQEGFLGSGSFRVEGDESQASGESGVVLSYPDDARVDGATTACFGDGTARVGFTVRVGSSWIGVTSVEIECDGAEQVIRFDEAFDAVNAVTIDGARTQGAGGVLVAVVSGMGSPGTVTP